MMTNIKNFEALEEKVKEVCIKARRELHAELALNAFPIVVKQWSNPVEKYAHIFYDAMFGKNKGVIKYLRPITLNIYMVPIIRAFENAGFIYKSDELYIKAAEVVAVQKFYHMHCFNKENFKKHSIYMNGKLSIGDYETEILCFILTAKFFENKGDMQGVYISRLFNLLYDRDTADLFDKPTYQSVIAEIRDRITESFNLEPALV